VYIYILDDRVTAVRGHGLSLFAAPDTDMVPHTKRWIAERGDPSQSRTSVVVGCDSRVADDETAVTAGGRFEQAVRQSLASGLHTYGHA
jgi:hypothetical protein